MLNRNQNEVKTTWILALLPLLGLAVFPYGWLSRRWWHLGWVMKRFFSSELAHVMGHFFLFVVIGTAVLLVFPRLRQRPFRYLVLLLLLGLLQESLQLASFKDWLLSDEILDLTVDLLGAGTAFVGRLVLGDWKPDKSLNSNLQ